MTFSSFVAEESRVSQRRRRGFSKWLVIGLLAAVTIVGGGVYMAMPEHQSPPFPASITMPEGATLVSIETSGSPSCAGGLCETTTYNYSAPDSVQSLCVDVIAAVERWSAAVLVPVDGSPCGATGTSRGWRIFIGIDRPTDLAPPASRIVITATKM